MSSAISYDCFGIKKSSSGEWIRRSKEWSRPTTCSDIVPRTDSSDLYNDNVLQDDRSLPSLCEKHTGFLLEDFALIKLRKCHLVHDAYYLEFCLPLYRERRKENGNVDIHIDHDAHHYHHWTILVLMDDVWRRSLRDYFTTFTESLSEMNNRGYRLMYIWLDNKNIAFD